MTIGIVSKELGLFSLPVCIMSKKSDNGNSVKGILILFLTCLQMSMEKHNDTRQVVTEELTHAII